MQLNNRIIRDVKYTTTLPTNKYFDIIKIPIVIASRGIDICHAVYR